MKEANVGEWTCANCGRINEAATPVPSRERCKSCGYHLGDDEWSLVFRT